MHAKVRGSMGSLAAASSGHAHCTNLVAAARCAPPLPPIASHACMDPVQGKNTVRGKAGWKFNKKYAVLSSVH